MRERWLGGLGAVLAVYGAGCAQIDAEPEAPVPEQRPQRQTAGGEALFTEITHDVGLEFMHESGHTESYRLPEVMGGGAAVFDYDNDGDLDIYLVNAGNPTPLSGDSNPAPNTMFRQEPDGRFTDVTGTSGLGETGYGMGCAVGDIDNDGDLDVFVTNWGPDVLYRNNGDGTFTDATSELGIDAPAWSTSAAFLDFDRDGFLDLFIANYVAVDPQLICPDGAGRPGYCSPQAFPASLDVLYHNDGGRRFVDVTDGSGIAAVRYAGLGVLCADFDDDGWIDIYVANDQDPNNLWVNQHDGTFRDDAILLGAAFNGHGIAEASMGIAAGDADADGDLDLFITHLNQETNTYYRNLGTLGFEDATASARLATASADYTGFGTAFFDYDNDGDLDLAVANGAVKRRHRSLSGHPPFWCDYVEPNHLFRNDGAGAFDDVSAQAGEFATRLELSRGLIPADIDRDGDLDLLLTNVQGPVRLYRNDQPKRAWLELRLIIPHLNREALGAKVMIKLEDRDLVRHAIPSGGYLTGGEATIHVGLSETEEVRAIGVRWPDGQEEWFSGCRARQRLVLRQGSGSS